MKISSKILALTLVASATMLQSCNDYFDTDPKNIINTEDYIAQEDEMYRGYMGILNCMQKAGDHAIFLTDTRGAVLETTDNAPTELKSIYNWGTTNGNSYADPTCYYSIIVACNDYIFKMGEYKRRVGNSMTENAQKQYYNLISGSLRLKVWAYLMLGKTYGEAYWFDDPLTEKKELSDASVFTKCNMQELADRCINLLENGSTVNDEHISATQEVEWFKWLDPETEDRALFRQWQYITPPAVILNAEWRSWRASYIDESAAQSDWQWIRDHVLDYIKNTQASVEADNQAGDEWRGIISANHIASGDVFQLSQKIQSDMVGSYSNIFYTEGLGSAYQLISTIIYNYDNDQKNRLVQYFCPEYPDAASFYLQPSEYGINLYPGKDVRSMEQGWIMTTLAGKKCIDKYYYGYDYTNRKYSYLDGKEIFKIQPAIPIFRGHDLHFLLAEAEAHLGHFEVAYYLLNDGVGSRFADKLIPTGSEWDLRYQEWLGGSGGYSNLGIAGAASSTLHKLPHPGSADFALYSTDELLKKYDWALADENIREYVAEGKSYGYMCKIAERYSNSAYRNGNLAEARDSVAKRIVPKYPATKQSHVSSSIKSNGYFVNWDLQGISNQ